MERAESVFQLLFPTVTSPLAATLKLLPAHIKGSLPTTLPFQYATERPATLVGLTFTEVAVFVTEYV
jgi:hypothetical protein